MQRDMFLATMIADRERPRIALPGAICVAQGDLHAERPRYRSGDAAADTLPDLCRALRQGGSTATHLQIFDRDPAGFRVAAIFCGIDDTAAWTDPHPGAADSARTAQGNQHGA